MEVLAGPDGLFRADQQSRLGRQFAEAASGHQNRTLRRGSLAFPWISLAGYDVLVSLFLAVVAAWGLKASLARQSRSR